MSHPEPPEARAPTAVLAFFSRVRPEVAARLDTELRAAFQDFERQWQGALQRDSDQPAALHEERLGRFLRAAAGWEQVLALFPQRTGLARPRRKKRSSLDRRLESHARRREDMVDLGLRLDAQLEGKRDHPVFPQRFGSALSALGLGPDARASEVRTAYRALARTHHPDLSQDAGTMVELNLAYASLMAWRREGARNASDAAEEAGEAPRGPQ